MKWICLFAFGMRQTMMWKWDVLVQIFWHAVAKDLSKQLKEITKALVERIDESNIILKYYEALKQRNKNLFLSLIDIDACSLHSVHGAICSGVETTFVGYKGTPCRHITSFAWLPSPTWKFWSCYKFKQVSTPFLCYKLCRK